MQVFRHGLVPSCNIILWCINTGWSFSKEHSLFQKLLTYMKILKNYYYII